MEQKDYRVSYSVLTLLIRWSVMMGGLMILSNVLAARIWGFTIFGLPWTFDAGLLAYPFTYVIGDLSSEIFGRKLANQMAFWSAMLCAFAFLCFWLAGFLPNYVGGENVEFDTALGFSLPIMLGSIIGFLVSQYLNNWLYEKIWLHGREEEICKRSLLSSVPSRLFDTLLFNTIAFGGRMSAYMLLEHSVMAFCAGMLVEALLSGYIKWRAPRVRDQIGFIHGARYVPTTLPEILNPRRKV